MKNNDLIKMNLCNLQLFAEGEEAGTEQATDPQPNDNEGAETETKPSQSELDSYANKAVQAALEKYKKDESKRIDDAIKAALAKEKDYAALSEDERKQRELDDERSRFEAEKAQFEHEKLVVQLQSDLVAKELPIELAETFALHSDKESALKAVSVLEAAWKEALAEVRKESLRQPDPSIGGATINNQSNFGAELAKRTNTKLSNKPFGN